MNEVSVRQETKKAGDEEEDRVICEVFTVVTGDCVSWVTLIPLVSLSLISASRQYSPETLLSGQTAENSVTGRGQKTDGGRKDIFIKSQETYDILRLTTLRLTTLLLTTLRLTTLHTYWFIVTGQFKEHFLQTTTPEWESSVRNVCSWSFTDVMLFTQGNKNCNMIYSYYIM